MSRAIPSIRQQLAGQIRDVLTLPTTGEVWLEFGRRRWLAMTRPYSEGGLGLDTAASLIFAYEVGRHMFSPHIVQAVTSIEILAQLQTSPPTDIRSVTDQAMRGEMQVSLQPAIPHSGHRFEVIAGQPLVKYPLPAPANDADQASIVLPIAGADEEALCARSCIRESAYLLGLASESTRLAASYISNRHQFAAPLRGNQGVTFPLVADYIRSRGYFQRLLDIAQHIDCGELPPSDLPHLADLVDDHVVQSVGRAVHAHGAAGLLEEHRVSQAWSLLPECTPARAFVSSNETQHIETETVDAAYSKRHSTAHSRLAHRVPQHWTYQEVAYAKDLCVHHLIERSAKRYSNRVALLADNRELTYAELEHQATQLAGTLQRHGARPGKSIGVYMYRSIEQVVAIYAIMKTGAAYVPLDVEHPVDRTRYIVSDSDMSTVVTHTALMRKLPGTITNTIAIDAYDLVSMHRATELELCHDNREILYVLYTSGSTGRPKGVEVEHRGIVNRLQWDAETFPMGEGDVVLHHTSTSFDAGQLEILTPLASGATLLLAKPQGARDVRYLAETISCYGVTTVMGVPSLLDVLSDEMLDLDTQSVRYVCSGGETLSNNLLTRLFRTFPGARVFNFYGPTEASIDATYWECRSPVVSNRIPIGVPIPNVRVVLLDESDEPVPVGMAGEICIGGVAVARGYRNLPDESRKLFRPDVFSNADSEEQLYHTGDLGRYRHDGAIEYLGRLDDQLKVRGFRIEPGEIESVVESHPDVRQAVVVQDRPGSLCAFVVKDSDVADQDIQHQISTTLPEYMRMANVHCVSTLPLQTTGKVDRDALAEMARRLRTSGPRAAGASLESAIIRLIEETIQGPVRSESKSFFEAGGTSLQAARLIARIRHELGLNVSMEGFLQQPSVQGILAASDVDQG